MLVFGRYKGQSVLIGDDISVTVLGVEREHHRALLAFVIGDAEFRILLRRDQPVMIGENVDVRITDFRSGGVVCIGTAAPVAVQVDRKEYRERVAAGVPAPVRTR